MVHSKSSTSKNSIDLFLDSFIIHLAFWLYYCNDNEEYKHKPTTEKELTNKDHLRTYYCLQRYKSICKKAINKFEKQFSNNDKKFNFVVENRKDIKPYIKDNLSNGKIIYNYIIVKSKEKKTVLTNETISIKCNATSLINMQKIDIHKQIYDFLY
jgi:hypothetical protein